MKVRFLLHEVFSEAGGVLTVTLALAAELAKRHDVNLVSLFGGEDEAVYQPPAGVSVTTLAPRAPDARARAGERNVWAVSQPSRLIPTSDERYGRYSLYTDAVLTNYLRSLRGGVLVTMQPGLNIAAAQVRGRRYLRVAQDHRPFEKRPSNLLRSYARHAGGLDALLALTSTDAEKFRELLGRKVPVFAMPNGAPEYHGPLTNQSSKTVIAAGRLQYSKGFDVLVAAWALVAREHPDWQLRICGEGELRPLLQRQIENLGLTDHVHLAGFRPDLQREMADASLFVLSSRAEGYPRVILEAMACGLPVVATDCPSGPRHMLRPGVDGSLVPSQDPAALAGAISKTLSDGALSRTAMGRAGLASARELSQPVVARRWEELFDHLAKPRRVPLRVPA